jgi:hypothetical protein
VTDPTSLHLDPHATRGGLWNFALHDLKRTSGARNLYGTHLRHIASYNKILTRLELLGEDAV